MEIFIKAENYQVWRVIEIGDFEVTEKNERGEDIPKPFSKFDKDDFDKMEMNNLAKKILHYGLGPHEHNRIIGCKSTKQMWELLQVTHQGTNEVKRSKIDMLMHKYELFQMKPKESVQEMLTRFSNIINELESLGKIITPEEQVRKVLRSLHQDEKWMAKVNAVLETKDFTTFNIEQLSGSLLTHEIHLRTHEVDSNRPKALALKSDDLEDSETDKES
ncbi:hypothetical protein BVRB_8g190190 [Beta vulgaris subsp. vulgaris]|nr:hypothetical protein BVRB_8g190190 [Beta vulgaris subsp. vulgaris]